MRALPLAVAAVAAVAALAGCMSSTPQSSTTSSTSAAPAHGWHLDCTLGAATRAVNASWAQDCEARASWLHGPKEETWAAVNPKDPDNVVIAAKDLNPDLSAKCVWNGVYYTKDGGRTWNNTAIGGNYADRAPTSPFYGYACNTDPDFRFTSNGDVHYAVEMYTLNNGGSDQTCVLPTGLDPTGLLACGFKILLATSHDGGATWPDVVTFQPDLVVTTDFSRMTVVPTTQTILEAIGSEGGSGCNVLRAAANLPQPTFEPVATKEGFPCNSGAGSGIAASPKGVAVLVGAAGIVARSTDDGLTWTDSNPLFPYTPIPGNFKESKYRTPGTLETAYDTSKGPNAGTLYACYPAADRKGDQADIFVRSSKDDGRTWSEPVLVNDDPVGTHQWMCNIGVAGDGSVHAFFMDKRYDPEHKLIDITHAWSMDGGKTWTNERVSTVSYDGDLGKHQEGFPFIGDYLGVECVGSDCWAGFPDASDGVTTVVAAAHVHLD